MCVFVYMLQWSVHFWQECVYLCVCVCVWVFVWQLGRHVVNTFSGECCGRFCRAVVGLMGLMLRRLLLADQRLNLTAQHTANLSLLLIVILTLTPFFLLSLSS